MRALIGNEPDNYRCIAVVGSRDFVNLDKVRYVVSGLPDGCTVVTGGARGVDKAAERTARLWLDPEPIIYEYGDYVPEHGPKAAGWFRNVDMLTTGKGGYPVDKTVIFWDGKSRGTKHSFKICREYKIPYVCFWDY